MSRVERDMNMAHLMVMAEEQDKELKKLEKGGK